MGENKILSFVLPSRTNLKYLKWAYNSIRKNLKIKHWICMADDASTDNTWEWMEYIMKEDSRVKCIKNEGPHRLGHTILYNRIIEELIETDIFCITHADMYICPGFDEEIFKYIDEKVVVSGTRIEPPLHNPGLEKIIYDFGIEPEEVNEEKLLNFVEEQKNKYKDKTTEGVFAPWAMYKKRFVEIGGHDSLFKPQSREDSDLFNRLQLDGFKFIQSWNMFTGHLTCRGSRFANGAKRNLDGQVFMHGRETDEWLIQNEKSTRNFIRKWGTMVRHDQYMKPIIPHKYNIGLVIHNCDLKTLRKLEPYCDTLYIDLKMEYISQYINDEQLNTKFNLSRKIKWVDSNRENDILVEFDADYLHNNLDALFFLSNMSVIISDSAEIGQMEYSIFKIYVKSLETYEKKLIKINNSIYL